MAEANAYYRTSGPLIIGRELVRPSTPALPEDVELPSPGYMPPPYFTVTDFRTLRSNTPDPFPNPIRERRVGFPAPGRRRVLLPRWVIRPYVSTAPAQNQPPLPSFAGGPSALVLVDFLSGQVVRAHEACEDARNPDGATTCTTCPLFYLPGGNAHVRPPM